MQKQNSENAWNALRAKKDFLNQKNVHMKFLLQALDKVYFNAEKLLVLEISPQTIFLTQLKDKKHQFKQVLNKHKHPKDWACRKIEQKLV
ncbi:MAG: hypothetical protein NWF02_01340 [Candidatus Bathyarchaeota archaeon]|nr:hypothetical protein [Candidatus Bathyarchaeum sp.]